MNSEQLQNAKFEMRNHFVNLMSYSVLSTHCNIQFSCKEQTTATGTLEAFDQNLKSIAVSNLQTPMSKHNSALLRSGDIAYIDFNLSS